MAPGQNPTDLPTEARTKVAIDERVNAAVGSAQPLRQRGEVLDDDSLLGGLQRRPEKYTELDRVER